jgi:hypothetical protein
MLGYMTALKTNATWYQYRHVIRCSKKSKDFKKNLELVRVIQ